MDSFLEFNTVGLIDTASINPNVAQAIAHNPITIGFYLLVSWINFLFLECRMGLVSLLLLLRR
jgi:hypothetical protein